MEANDGSAGIVLAGLAIREIIPATRVVSFNATTSVTEGSEDGGTTAFTFTVERTGDTNSAATVNFGVTGIGGNPVDVMDFGGALPSGQIQFLAGQSTSEAVTLNISSDSVFEPDERFLISLSAPSDGARLDATGFAVTIANDDEPGQGVTRDTIGLYQGDVSLFHLKNSFTPGASDQYFAFGPGGNAGWIPLAGDWNGDGIDTIGLYQPDQSIFHLKNSFTPGASDHYFVYGPGGNAGWKPLVGDWDGNGTDTVGLYQPDVSLFHLKNTLSSGASDQFFAFGPSGNAGWTPLAGDWNGDGTDTIGFYQPDVSLYHLKDSFTPGASDQYFAFGPGGNAGWLPLTGDWNGPSPSPPPPPPQARPATVAATQSRRNLVESTSQTQRPTETIDFESATGPIEDEQAALYEPVMSDRVDRRSRRPEAFFKPGDPVGADHIAAIDEALKLLTDF